MHRVTHKHKHTRHMTHAHDDPPTYTLDPKPTHAAYIPCNSPPPPRVWRRTAGACSAHRGCRRRRRCRRRRPRRPKRAAAPRDGRRPYPFFLSAAAASSLSSLIRLLRCCGRCVVGARACKLRSFGQQRGQINDKQAVHHMPISDSATRQHMQFAGHSGCTSVCRVPCSHATRQLQRGQPKTFKEPAHPPQNVRLYRRSRTAGSFTRSRLVLLEALKLKSNRRNRQGTREPDTHTILNLSKQSEIDLDWRLRSSQLTNRVKPVRM